jgi:hypothetical protein
VEANFSPLFGEVREDECDKADREDTYDDPDAAREGVSEWNRGGEVDHRRRFSDLGELIVLKGRVSLDHEGERT